MKLTRVRVPEFRALKNIDITFEPDFVPNIFPLGSQNGGGKSTLLQLIFALLSSLRNPVNTDFLQNIFSEFKPNTQLFSTVCILDLKSNLGKEINLEFIVCSNPNVKPLMDELNASNDTNQFFEDKKNEISKLESELKQKKSKKQELVQNKDNELDESKNNKYNVLPNYNDKILDIETSILKIEAGLNSCKKNHRLMQKIYNTKNFFFLSAYTNSKLRQSSSILYKISGDFQEEDIKKIIIEISQKIFLSIPSTQPILLLNPKIRNLLFTDQFHEYQIAIRNSKSKSGNLFTYDFLPIDLLIDFFEKAFSQDIQKGITTKGIYGDNYRKRLEEFNNVLRNKKINVTPDRTGVTFEMEDEDGTIRELYPEDLSHGELKRLSIYLWLKYYDIKDSIVLMDEIEIAFHPDWQYQIIRDLQEWGPSNQYILATHSYELCEALTPAHVKEINPHLLPSQEHEPQS